DRLEELLKNYRKAEGTMTEAFGEEWFRHDYRQRMWGHRRVAEENYPKLPAHLRAICEAYQKGVARYMSEHPSEVPRWAPKLEPWQVIALGRFIIWGWPEGEAGGDLLRGGIQPDPVAYHGSNQMLLAPSRTAMKAPIAVIDPHLSWYGEFRFYEIRMYAKDFALSGASIAGLPFPTLGHSRWASVAMTTGGPDTSDIFEEEVRDGRYRFKDDWRMLEVRHEKIAGKDVTIESTHHGPIVAHKDGKAYAAAIPYANEFRLVEQSWQMMNAHNLGEMKKALAMLQFMAQNIMVGTVDGDIYYVRNGRVPIRPAGCDSSRPMPGSTGACEWQGIHPFEDLVQIANPSQGYMQNCNVSPQWMMKDSPLTPERYAARPYLYNAPPGPAHQRASMTVEQLSQADHVTAEDAIHIAFSPEVFRAGEWQERIRKAVPEPNAFVRAILGWNRRSEADSHAALDYYLFKMALGAPVSRAVTPQDTLTNAQIVAAMVKAEDRLTKEFPPNATFGTYFRVGREGGSKTYPASGGSLAEAGMATPRAIGFAKKGDVMVGQSGQTSTQIVILTKPPQSFMVLPLGNSDHKDSPHFDDQAEKLFSRSQAKSTYFLNRAELLKHQTEVKSLEF
ncbi:MAG TPA: penicillin acylase family protein, partial [Bryobacteraceae bacterium]|nr:penicillin acylase family protein [Bryobacteraceae bacterium]